MIKSQTTGLRELGDGLVLRQATAEDMERLAAYNSLMHRDPGMTEPHPGIVAWTRDLMNGSHPTMRAEDFTVVENARTGEIVSSMNLISQTWTYDGTPFRVGRPELVSTHPEYRRRGLVREQFEVIHAWSAQRGEQVQVITGIPWYYRQFGYEMTLELGGGRMCYASQIPQPEGESEPYRLRPANEADLPFLKSVYEFACQRSLVSAEYDDRMWRYEVSGRSPDSVNREEFYIVESNAGEPVGYVGCFADTYQGSVATMFYELAPQRSWLEVTPGVLRGLKRIAAEYATRHSKEFNAFGFWFGSEHPLFDLMPGTLTRVMRPYAFYVRVPDVPAFIRTIAPVLETRLAGSLAVGYTGTLELNFYVDGLRIEFERGRLKAVEPWKSSQPRDGNAHFTGLTFLHLLFGHHSLDELKATREDCWADNDTTRALLNILFPKRASSVWAVS